MQTMMKIIVLLFCVNMFVYIGGNYQYMITGDLDDKPVKVSGDLIDIFMKNRPTTLNSTAEATTFNSNFSIPQKESGELVGTGGGISFLDIPKILWGFFATLFNVASAGIMIFFIEGMPPIIGLLVGVPLTLVFLLSIFAFIRGVSD